MPSMTGPRQPSPCRLRPVLVMTAAADAARPFVRVLRDSQQRTKGEPHGPGYVRLHHQRSAGYARRFQGRWKCRCSLLAETPQPSRLDGKPLPREGRKRRTFNCVNLQLTADDLDRLEADIRAGNLPSTSGFFFGEFAARKTTISPSSRRRGRLSLRALPFATPLGGDLCRGGPVGRRGFHSSGGISPSTSFHGLSQKGNANPRLRLGCF